MGEYIGVNFTYSDVFKGEDLYNLLKIDDSSKPEEILIRLLLGSIDIQEKFCLNKVKQRINMFTLPFSNVAKVNKDHIYSFFIQTLGEDVLNLSTKKKRYERCEKYIDRYIKSNRVNIGLYKNILEEVTLFFYNQSKKSYIAAFVNIYRCLEHMSYTFPLVYASKSKSYCGTYKDLKSFFEGKDTSELRFFRRFQDSVIEKEVRQLTFTIEFSSAPTEIVDILDESLKKLYQDAGVRQEIIETNLVEYQYMIDFIITVRNRYFHFLAGDIRNTTNIDKVDMNYFFEATNLHMMNWLVYIYGKIIGYGLEQIQID